MQPNNDAKQSSSEKTINDVLSDSKLGTSKDVSQYDNYDKIQLGCDRLIDGCIEQLNQLYNPENGINEDKKDQSLIAGLDEYREARTANGSPSGFLMQDLAQLRTLYQSIYPTGAYYNDVFVDTLINRPGEKSVNDVNVLQNMVKRHSDPDKLQEHLNKLAECPACKDQAAAIRKLPEESTPEPSLSRLKAAAQSVARATASFFRPLSNFSQYIKDRYEFGARISTVLWRAKDAHAEKPDTAIIPHVNSILEESKKDTDTRTHARPDSALSTAVSTVISTRLGDGQGGIKPGLSKDDVIEQGGKITLDDLREELRELKTTLFKDGFETNTAKVHPDNESDNKPDNERGSFASERDSAYSDRSSSFGGRRSMLSELSHQAEEELNEAQKTREGFSDPDPTNDKPLELDPTDENYQSESGSTKEPKPD